MDRGARAVLHQVAEGFELLPEPGGPAVGDGPLGWPGYDAGRARSRERCGESESVLCGTGRVGGHHVVLIAFEFGYIGGSIGGYAGARICAALAEARRRRLAVVSLIAS